ERGGVSARRGEIHQRALPAAEAVEIDDTGALRLIQLHLGGRRRADRAACRAVGIVGPLAAGGQVGSRLARPSPGRLDPHPLHEGGADREGGGTLSRGQEAAGILAPVPITRICCPAAPALRCCHDASLLTPPRIARLAGRV